MSNKVLSYAYALTKRQTRHEKLVEGVVCKLGIPYRFQHIELRKRAGAILDFAFPTLMVALEVDGPDHLKPAKRQKDRERTAILAALGWKVVRITNGQVDTDVTSAVMTALKPYLPKETL